jgi:hypothetical protein
VRKLKLKNKEEWRMSREAGQLPSNIPTNPDKTYRDDGWISLPDWLGYTGAPQLKDMLPFLEARVIARKLKLKSQKEWVVWSKSGKRPSNVPSHPDRTYRDDGWISTADWLGYTGKPRKQKTRHGLLCLQWVEDHKDAYPDNMSPTPEQREQLATDADVEYVQIKGWFERYRAADRKKLKAKGVEKSKKRAAASKGASGGDGNIAPSKKKAKSTNTGLTNTTRLNAAKHQQKKEGKRKRKKGGGDVVDAGSDEGGGGSDRENEDDGVGDTQSCRRRREAGIEKGGKGGVEHKGSPPHSSRFHPVPNPLNKAHFLPASEGGERIGDT